MSIPWPISFPPAAYFTDTATLVAHPDFKPAKRGSLQAARRVVEDLAQWDSTDYLASCIRPHALAAVLSPGEGENQLPTALSEALSQRLGIPVLPVRKKPMGRRTKASALDRFTHRPQFETETGTDLLAMHSEIPRMARVLMVDDVITTGGSLSELRLFLWDHDLWAVGASVIASTPSRVRHEDGARLAPKQDTIRKLIAKHSDAAEFLADNGIYHGVLGCLTEAEARTLLSLPTLQGTPAGVA